MMETKQKTRCLGTDDWDTPTTESIQHASGFNREKRKWEEGVLRCRRSRRKVYQRRRVVDREKEGPEK